MQRLRTVTSLDVSAVAGHHAMPAALLFISAEARLFIFHLCRKGIARLPGVCIDLDTTSFTTLYDFWAFFISSKTNFNPFLTSGLVHPLHLDESVRTFMVFW